MYELGSAIYEDGGVGCNAVGLYVFYHHNRGHVQVKTGASIGGGWYGGLGGQLRSG